MNASTNSTQVSVGHDLIAGYRSIADSMSSSGRDSPTPEMDSAILAAACGNSRRRRTRPAGYAAIAAGVAAAVGLAVITASRHPAAVALAASAERENWGEHSAASAPHAGVRSNDNGRGEDPHIGTVIANGSGLHGRGRTSTNGLDSLVFSASPADTGLRTASEVHSGSEIQTTTQTATGLDAQHDAIDLNQPGALQRLARENPFHYAMIRRILAGVDEVPEHAVSRWMKSQFNATDITYSAVLMTSAPPRKQLSFTLENTRYSAVLTLTPDGARLFSARP
jgi:hypothetical protein